MRFSAVAVSAMHILELVVRGGFAITPPDTSLDTIPVGYFGGVNCKHRAQENIEYRNAGKDACYSD